MPRIIISCKTLFKGGAEKQALILAKLLSGAKIDVTLVNWYADKIAPEYLKYIDEHSIRYITLKGNLIRKFFSFLRIVRDEKISVILSYLTLANILSGLTKLFVKNVVTIGGIRNEKLPYHKFFFERLVHNHLNDATVFNNYSAGRTFVNRGFTSGKIFVIHNAIENIQTVVRPERQDSEIRIITVSRFVKQKDFFTSLHSFRKLLDINKELNLVYYIVGFGPLEDEIRSLIVQLNLADSVKIFINPSDIPAILKECDIYLSTSLFEGLSNSLMEAMIFGLPVVATDVGDNSYLIKEGLNGYLTRCKDIETISEKLNNLAESSDLRARFGKYSQDKIIKEFTQERMLANYITLLSKFDNKQA